MKRRFNEKEMGLATKSLKNLEEEKDWNEYQVQYFDLMLKVGLEMNYKKNIRDFKVKKHEFETDLEMLKKNISVLQDQIRNGVEIKENPIENEEKKNE